MLLANTGVVGLMSLAGFVKLQLVIYTRLMCLNKSQVYYGANQNRMERVEKNA